MSETVSHDEDATVPQLRPIVPVRWLSAGRTDVGKVRRINEDALLDRPDVGLWVVADGVGGESAGDRASGLVVEALGKVGQPDTAATFLAEVHDSLQAVNGLLRLEAAANGGDRLIASTVVALLIFGHDFACAWAGDSRLYRWRDRHFMQVSRDHSEVQEMVDRGVLTPQEARVHPSANVVTRAVGAEDKLALEMVQDEVRPGDLLLLCSDGLTKMLADDEIAALLPDRPAGEAVDALIAAALERGASDNVTAVLVKIEAADTEVAGAR